MSKRHLESLLREELVRINDTIDQKIIRGLSYTKEARRHKFITARLRQLNKRSGWFSRMLFATPEHV